MAFPLAFSRCTSVTAFTMTMSCFLFAFSLQDDIAAFIAKHGLVIDDLYGELTTLHGKYKLMEASLEDGRTRAKKKAPELESSLEAIKMLEAKQEANETASAFYQLADNIFTKADIKPQNKVALWLGASVMVEYSYEEATKLLGEQLLAARTKIVSSCPCSFRCQQNQKLCCSACCVHSSPFRLSAVCPPLLVACCVLLAVQQHRGPDVPPRPNHHDRGQPRPCLQLHGPRKQEAEGGGRSQGQGGGRRSGGSSAGQRTRGRKVVREAEKEGRGRKRVGADCD